MLPKDYLKQRAIAWASEEDCRYVQAVFSMYKEMQAGVLRYNGTGTENEALHKNGYAVMVRLLVRMYLDRERN